MGEALYFVRVRGRILGPFNLGQLQGQRDRGFFSSVHEVSTDRRKWVSAATLTDLFPNSESAPPADDDDDSRGPAAPGRDQWYYEGLGGDRLGPVPSAVIRAMVQSRQLAATTRVCAEGMRDWVTVQEAGFGGRSRRGKTRPRALGKRLAWIAAVATVLLLAGGTYWVTRHLTADRRPPTEEVVEKAVPAVALINGNRGFGTGFLIAPGIIATNAHVVSKQFMSRVTAQFTEFGGAAGQPLKAEIIHFDPERDLALLRVNTTIPPLILARDYRFRKGQSVVAIGNPAIGDQGDYVSNALSDGIVSAQKTVDDATFYQISMSVNPGNSGGPVLDSSARVIGVVSAKLHLERMTLVIPVSDLDTALQTALRRSPEDIERVSLDHQSFVAFTWLYHVTTLYRRANVTYVRAMREARGQGQNINVGLNSASKAIDEMVEAYNKNLTEDLQPNLAKIVYHQKADPRVRENLEELWKAYLDLKKLFDRTGVTLDEYERLFNGLCEKCDKHIIPLKLKFPMVEEFKMTKQSH